MISRFIALPIAALLLVSAAFASDNDDLRTADQAKAMLAQAVAAVKADKAKALDMFNKGEGGFRDGHLYVTCTISATASSSRPATLIQKIFWVPM